MAYQKSLAEGFVAAQRRLDGEPLEDYIKPVGGGFFFVLPGPGRGPDGVVGPIVARNLTPFRSIRENCDPRPIWRELA